MIRGELPALPNINRIAGTIRGMIRKLTLALVAFAGMAAAMSASAQADFRSCLSGLRSQAAAKGISGEAFDLATRGIEADLKILELMDSQPEFKTEIWDYLSALVDDQRVQDGTAAMQQWGRALSQAEARFGVDRYVIAGVWGVESDFGKNFGDRPLVQSLATLSCYAPRRQAYFAGELMATLKIVQDGDIDPRLLKGSWAGAFGHTQFMPSTFQRLAVDGDGDGRRDVVSSVARCDGVDRELPEEGRLGERPSLGLRGPPPLELQPLPRRSQEETRPRFLGRHGRHPGRWAAACREITQRPC